MGEMGRRTETLRDVEKGDKGIKIPPMASSAEAASEPSNTWWLSVAVIIYGFAFNGAGYGYTRFV